MEKKMNNMAGCIDTAPLVKKIKDYQAFLAKFGDTLHKSIMGNNVEEMKKLVEYRPLLLSLAEELRSTLGGLSEQDSKINEELAEELKKTPELRKRNMMNSFLLRKVITLMETVVGRIRPPHAGKTVRIYGQTGKLNTQKSSIFLNRIG